MTDKRQPSFHFGGPLGLAGMALLASAAGLVVYGGMPEAETVNPANITEVGEVPDTDLPKVDVPQLPATGDEPAENLEDSETPEQTDAGSGDTAVVTKPPPRPDLKPKRPVTTSPEIESQPATSERAELTFIVRIKNAPEIDQAVKLFRKDRPAAEKAFATYAEAHPKLKDFSLIGASYSGDLTLSYALKPGVEPSQKIVRAVQDQILAIEGVAYADPDYIAHPGDKKGK